MAAAFQVTTFLPYLVAPCGLTSACLECGHPISARTEAALVEAANAHGVRVHDVADPTIDPHFEDARLDALIHA